MSITAKTSIIVPFHFREHLEHKLDERREPVVVSIACAWSDRYIPIPNKAQHTPPPEGLANIPAGIKLTERLDQLPPQRCLEPGALKEFRKKLFKSLTQDTLDSLGLNQGQAHAFFAAEVDRRVQYIQPLWCPLNEIDLSTFDHHHPQEFEAQQERFIAQMKRLPL